MPNFSMRDPENRHRSIYLLPNAFTTAALFAGFYAVVQAMNDRFEIAAIATFVAMVLDGMDGRVARLTNTQSSFGEQYDSLSDMTSFGVAPALVIYEWILQDLGRWAGWPPSCTGAGALRLARFNTNIAVVDKRFFQGCPAAARGAGGRLRLAGHRQQTAHPRQHHGLGGLCPDDVRRRGDSQQRLFFFSGKNFPWAQRAVLGHPAGGGRVRVRLQRSAGGAVRPVRAFVAPQSGWVINGAGLRPRTAAGIRRPSFP